MEKLFILTEILSTISVAYNNVQGRHWNVTGEHFLSLHKLFNDIYSLLYECKDKIAEIMRQLNYTPPFSLTRYLEMSLIKDQQTIDSWEIMSVKTKDELKIIIDLINKYLDEIDFDPETQNDLSQIGSLIRQQYYFINSFCKDIDLP